MRHLIIILTIIFPLITFGQVEKKIKVINGATNQPLSGYYCYILENNDKWVDIGTTNEEGIFTTHLSDLDSNATYQFDISNRKIIPFRQNINPFDNKMVTVTIFPDTTFRERNPNLVYLECSTKSFGYYHSKSPLSMYDLPDSIRIKLEAHLIDRLGADFYAKIKISGGQIIDLDRLYIVEKDAVNYKWTPYSYYLCFSFQDTTKGIGLYTAKIVLDKYGNVIEEIQLPNIKDNPDKATIISKEQAKIIATENKFYDENTYISISYDEQAGSITWRFTQKTYEPNHTVWGSTWEIDAHNGKVLGKYGFGGMWD